MGSQVAVLWEGRLIQVDTPASRYRTPVTAALARFVGEAVVLDGVLAGGFVDCALGRVPVQADLRRDRSLQVDAMVRPEQIRILPARQEAAERVAQPVLAGVDDEPVSGGTAGRLAFVAPLSGRASQAEAATRVYARIAEIAYFGHDASVRLRLESDPTRAVSARVSGQVPLAAGQRVELSLHGGAVIYSKD